ncbi:MAG TPA: DUF2239 family protein [Bryobacteraceae bacterium]|nr:DUF2239 family protein [Bryobacteraceae bacterium]
MESSTYTAFLGWKRVASGPLDTALRQIKEMKDSGDETLLIFEDATGKQVDFDMRGSIDEVLARVAPKSPRTGPGRPKLGVVSREISLLPRHWEWLEAQPQGASAAIRRLVEDARKQGTGASRAKVDAIGRVMTALAGNLPGFEEAYRALYARDGERLVAQIADWPADVRDYILEADWVAEWVPVGW